jgi:surface antigen
VAGRRLPPTAEGSCRREECLPVGHGPTSRCSLGRRNAFAVGLLLLVPLAGCTSTRSQKEAVGLIGGAATGALIGTGIGGVAAIAIGAVAGGFAGDRIGHSLDERDRAEARRAERSAVILGKPIVWHNRRSGHSGTVRPIKTFVDAHGRKCREFSHTIVIDGQKQTGIGVGCREKGGRWVLEGEPMPPASPLRAEAPRSSYVK